MTLNNEHKRRFYYLMWDFGMRNVCGPSARTVRDMALVEHK